MRRRAEGEERPAERACGSRVDLVHRAVRTARLERNLLLIHDASPSRRQNLDQRRVRRGGTVGPSGSLRMPRSRPAIGVAVRAALTHRHGTPVSKREQEGLLPARVLRVSNRRSAGVPCVRSVARERHASRSRDLSGCPHRTAQMRARAQAGVARPSLAWTKDVPHGEPVGRARKAVDSSAVVLTSAVIHGLSSSSLVAQRFAIDNRDAYGRDRARGLLRHPLRQQGS